SPQLALAGDEPLTQENRQAARQPILDVDAVFVDENLADELRIGENHQSLDANFEPRYWTILLGEAQHERRCVACELTEGSADFNNTAGSRRKRHCPQ